MKLVIVAAGRTPVGAFGGGLASLSAVDLGSQLLTGLLDKVPAAKDQIDEVILGQVLTAGCGQNTARQTALKSGLSESVSAMTINKVCGSGLKAVQLAAQAILAGDAELVVAGGQESMSNAPHVLPNSRNGSKMGNWAMEDSMVKDGLWDAFNDYHMGVTAENIAKKYDISRADQDAFAVASQQKAGAAMEVNRFAEEILPISVPQRKKDPIIVSLDEQPKPNTKLEKLASLRAAFDKEGTVTAGNASSLNDGAAMVIVASEEKAKALGLPILAEISGYANTGISPEIMGTGPITATRKCLEKAQWQISASH